MYLNEYKLERYIINYQLEHPLIPQNIQHANINQSTFNENTYYYYPFDIVILYFKFPWVFCVLK